MRFRIEQGLITKVLRSIALGEPAVFPFVPHEDGVRLAYDTITFNTRLGLVVLRKESLVVGSVNLTELGGSATEVTLTGLDGAVSITIE